MAGEVGRPVAKVGGFGTDLERRVQLPDSALAHTQKYNSLSKLSTGLLVAGAAAIFIPAFVDRGDAGPRVAVSVAGLGLAIAGGAVQAGARNHLNQALWWYNAGFAR